MAHNTCERNTHILLLLRETVLGLRKSVKFVLAIVITFSSNILVCQKNVDFLFELATPLNDN